MQTYMIRRPLTEETGKKILVTTTEVEWENYLIGNSGNELGMIILGGKTWAWEKLIPLSPVPGISEKLNETKQKLLLVHLSASEPRKQKSIRHSHLKPTGRAQIATDIEQVK